MPELELDYLFYVCVGVTRHDFFPVHPQSQLMIACMMVSSRFVSVACLYELCCVI